MRRYAGMFDEMLSARRVKNDRADPTAVFRVVVRLVQRHVSGAALFRGGGTGSILAPEIAEDDDPCPAAGSVPDISEQRHIIFGIGAEILNVFPQLNGDERNAIVEQSVQLGQRLIAVVPGAFPRRKIEGAGRHFAETPPQSLLHEMKVVMVGVARGHADLVPPVTAKAVPSQTVPDGEIIEAVVRPDGFRRIECAAETFELPLQFGNLLFQPKERPQPEPEPQQPAQETKPEPAPKTEAEKQREEYETRKAAFVKQGQQAVTDGLERKEFIAYEEERARLDTDRLQLTGKAREEHIADFKKRFMEEQRKNFEAIAGKLAAEYQPGMEKYGDLPKLVFNPNPKPKSSHVTFTGSELHILTTGTPDYVKWNQLDGTIKHEFEHWLQIKAMKADPTLVDKIREAGTADWKRIKESYKGHIEMLKGENSVDMVARWLYSTDYGSLSQDQQYAVIGFTDSFGSLAGGKGYGFGHPQPGYYKKQNKGLLYGEAIANVKALQSSVPRDKLQRFFPELDKLVTELQKNG